MRLPLLKGGCKGQNDTEARLGVGGFYLGQTHVSKKAHWVFQAFVGGFQDNAGLSFLRAPVL